MRLSNPRSVFAGDCVRCAGSRAAHSSKRRALSGRKCSSPVKLTPGAASADVCSAVASGPARGLLEHPHAPCRHPRRSPRRPYTRRARGPVAPRKNLGERYMHRSSERRAPPAKPAADAQAVDQQHDAPDALRREHGASDRMRMPHERDEAPASAGASTSGRMPDQGEVMGQAADDLARGLRDTDCRGEPAEPGSPCPPRAAAARPRVRTHSVGAAAPARLGRAARRMRRAGA
jgi:hypothetical protein